LYSPREAVGLPDLRAALRTSELLALPEDPGAEVARTGPGALPAGAALESRGDPYGALVGDRNGLVRRRLAVRLLAQTASLAGAVPAKGMVRLHRLARTEIFVTSAARTAELVTVFPVALPLRRRVDINH